MKLYELVNIEKRFFLKRKLAQFQVGNKCEAVERRVVSEQDAKQFAEAMHIPFFETSAKENYNVEKVRGFAYRSHGTQFSEAILNLPF